MDRLQNFKQRLNADVVQAYANRGSDFGGERFAAWRRQFSKFLKENLPGTNGQLDIKLNYTAYYRGRK